MIVMYFKSKAILLIISLISCFLISCGNQQFEQGKKLYQTHCESCHQTDGEGLAKLYPPLKNSDYWTDNQDQIPCIIRNGLKDTIIVNNDTYSTPMLGIPQLTDYEICNIMNYINQNWYDNQKKTQIKEVKNNLEKCK